MNTLEMNTFAMCFCSVLMLVTLEVEHEEQLEE